MKFVGRDQELRDLKALARKRTSSLVTCRGRRRIGKSTLIREFGKTAARFLEFEGLPPREGITNDDQLAAFSEQLARQSTLPRLTFDSWPQAFELLISTLQDEHTVILLDEISWLGGQDPDFAGHLKTAWERMRSQHDGIVLVLCGSVSAWIEKNILQGTGFVGRNSWDIVLDELPLSCCDRFWGRWRERISTADKLAVLSVTGGVPRYLEEIDPGLSADDNLQRLCFRPEGILFREFDQIFSDIFGRRSRSYREILSALTHGSHTLTQICEKTGRPRSGHMTAILNDLQLAGFVAKDRTYDPSRDRVSRTEHYRLKDNYSRFFLRYIEPRRDAIEQGLARTIAPSHLPGWDSLLGIQFENLVLGNMDYLLGKLGLVGNQILYASPYFQKPTARKRGCQVDLLIVSRHALHVVEIKRRRHIGHGVIAEIQEKIDRLPSARRSIRTVLVHQGELAESVRREGYLDAIITGDDLLRGD